MALFRVIQEYISLDAYNIARVEDKKYVFILKNLLRYLYMIFSTSELY